MLGYVYPDVIEDDITVYNLGERNNNKLIQEAKTEALQMNCYPYDGYIKVLDDEIVIKLGDID